ncbi:hypothetical protein CNMCM8927_003381 [Aspergillus lentulus]|uniref:LON peptidase N-terminal domain and RING finger protein 1 n=1 Tax=Aspergillus lentulus TaxID=293939 RepID=A0AAN5YZ10_ASPLE|nr:hypothetical protein CNMCM8927_003381 [Aspergillus lentulus]
MENDPVTFSPHSPHDDSTTASAATTSPDKVTTSQPILAHSLIRLIQCSHCLRPLCSPLRLPCGNTFCRACLPPLHERKGITYPADKGRKQGFRCYWRGQHNCHGEHCVGDCGVDVLLSRLVDVFDEVLAHTAAASDTSNEGEDGLRMTWKGFKGQEPTQNCADIGPDVLRGVYNLVSQARFDCDATEIIYERALEDCSGYVDQSSALFERLKDSIRNELDCQVCYSLITDPLTTTCGHTFCRGCVATVLDHSDLCPICRRKLNMSSTINSEPVNKRISDITQLFFSDQLASQRQSLAEEQSDSDAGTILPLFVNSLSFPTMPTFLRIFEPRYCLMIRRVMESRDRKFGMVMYNRLGRPQGQLGASQFMQYGTVLRVERFEPLPGGRSLIFANGVSRFKVIKSHIVDGYHVGQIQRVDDIPIAEEENLESLETSTISQRSTEARPSQQPLDSMSTQELFQLGLDFVRKRRGEGARWLHPRVLMAYGDIPSDPAQFPWWLACVFPVSEEEKYTLLSATSVRERLKITAQWARRAEARECCEFLLSSTRGFLTPAHARVTLDQRPLPPNTSLLGADYVTILKSEYQQLLQASNHLKKLKDSLLGGGLSQETLDILVYGADLPSQSSEVSRELHEQKDIDGLKNRSVTQSKSSNDYGNASYEVGEIYEEDTEDDGIVSPNSDEKDDYEESRSADSVVSSPAAQRTVFIRGLPDRVTHQDVVDAVRGGGLLHLYLRARDHAAYVSFVEPAAAAEFLQHAKTHGCHIAGKRVEVSWNDRQFYLPPYVGSKIRNGATRNLVIHNVNANITESLIRRDLEHIHNLIVITVKFKQGNAYISTNSVHNTLFARSCMMSRGTYKGMRIGFYPDECAGLLSELPSGPKREVQPASKKSLSASNRFQLLSLDGSGDDDVENHESLPGALGTQCLNGSINIAESRVSA